MDKYGICGVELQWFKDYLSNRMQYVTYENYKSSHAKVHCGVPQGSILGPIQFLLYINDLTSVSENCFSVMFADDTNTFITGKYMDVLCHQLNEDLRNVQEWLHCNKLSLNVLKTHYMVFTSRNRVIDDIDVKIQGVQIQRVYATKFLGVQIDSQLTWKIHMEYTCKKFSKCVGILCKARKKIYKSTLISLYYSFAYPYFIYCNHVRGKNYSTCLERISRIQKKLIRIITCYHFEPIQSPYILQIKFWMFVTSMTTSLVLSCMNVYMAISLIYSEAIFREMLMYMTIIFEMQMIYTCHMGDLISENSVSKL